MSAYLLVSLHANVLNPFNHKSQENATQAVVDKFSTHDWWDEGTGWKNLRDSLRLVIQPFVSFNLIKPRFKVFPIPHLSLGFPRLIALMNLFPAAVPTTAEGEDFSFSSA